MSEYICVFCEKPVLGIQASAGIGFAHPYCYEVRSPFEPVESFDRLLTIWRDPALARHVVTKFFPEERRQVAVDEFNNLASLDYDRRMKMLKESYDDEQIAEYDKAKGE